MDVLGFLAALGAAQGLLFCVLVALRYRTRAHLPLAFLLFAFSLRLGTIPSWNPVAILDHPWLLPLTTPLPFLFGPLLWWYTYEVSTDGARPRLLPLHFVPYAVGTAIAIMGITLRSEAEHARFVADLFGGQPQAEILVPNAIKVALNVIYVGLAGKKVFGRPSSRLEQSRRVWLGGLVLASLFSLIPYAYVALDPTPSVLLTEGSSGPFVLVAAGMTLFVYAVSAMSMVTPEVPVCSDSPTRRSGSFLPESECHEIAERVREELDEGELRNPDLTLGSLADRLGVHANRVSAAVNHEFRMSFRQYLNHRRVEYFMLRVSRGELGDKSILQLAMDCGFPSKSTFNRVFKEATGMTPSAKWSLIKSASGPSRMPTHSAREPRNV